MIKKTMKFYNKKNDRQSAWIAIICAVIFCLFSFVYLYFYQADILAVAQHILSGGVTTYNKLVGAVIITLILSALQMWVSSIIKFDTRLHALTYFPSVLLMSVLCSMFPENDGTIAVGFGLWLSLFFFILWGGILTTAVRFRHERSKRTATAPALSTIWKNIFVMGLMFLFLGIAGNNNPVNHYRTSVEQCLKNNDFEEAIRVGCKSQDTDPTLTMLRIYALAHEGKLADELFKYPVSGNSNAIVPMENSTQCLLYSNDSIYKFLGAKPKTPMKVKDYLRILQNSGFASSAVKDYILCGYLIDRRLDDFAKALPQYYTISDSLPVHYREAMTLYTHLRSKPIAVYHNDVMDTDYEDMLRLERKSASAASRRIAVYEQYAGTYWWYYKYKQAF